MNQANNLNLNIMSDKDGSVYSDSGKKYGGAEYITGVLTGDAGFRQIKLLCKELTKKTLVNKTCSVHVHIGSEFDNLFVLFMYMLGIKIEDELYSLVSPNRNVNSNGDLNEYCKKLRPLALIPFSKATPDQYNKVIDSNFKKVFEWISCGNSEGPNCNRSTNHPKGAKCGYDRSTSRYCWVNMVPTYFNTRNNKSYTIEFRLMGETTNYYKIRNWILLCMAIVWFVENRRNDIINDYVTINNVRHDLNIFTILRVAYPTKGESLVNYFMKRQDFFKKHPSATEADLLTTEINNDEEIDILNIIKEANKSCV